MLKRHPTQILRKILYVQIENLAVRTAQDLCCRWYTHPYLVTDRANDGTIYAISPVAQQSGITPKMTLSQALDCCPLIELIHPTDAPNPALQEKIFQLLHQYTDLVEKISDTAFFLDITFNKQDIPIGFRAAQLLHNHIRHELGLCAVFGLGPNKLLAQLAGRSSTNRSISAVDRDDTTAFLQDLSVDLLPGLGRKTRAALSTLGIDYIGQLARMSLTNLQQHVGRPASRLHQYAQGIDNDPVSPAKEANSLSKTIRFSAPLYNEEDIRINLQEPISTLAASMRRRTLRSRHIVVHVSFVDGLIERGECSLSHYTDSSHTLLAALMECLKRLRANDTGVRELYVEIQQFTDRNAKQLDLFQPET